MMITFVCLCNLAIALINFYIAWRVWKQRRFLINVTRTLTEVERTIHLLLVPAPALITKGQIGTRLLSDRLQKLELLLQQIQSIFWVLNLVYGTWQRQFRLIRLSRLPRKGNKIRV